MLVLLLFAVLLLMILRSLVDLDIATASEHSQLPLTPSTQPDTYSVEHSNAIGDNPSYRLVRPMSLLHSAKWSGTSGAGAASLCGFVTDDSPQSRLFTWSFCHNVFRDASSAISVAFNRLYVLRHEASVLGNIVSFDFGDPETYNFYSPDDVHLSFTDLGSSVCSFGMCRVDTRPRVAGNTVFVGLCWSFRASVNNIISIYSIGMRLHDGDLDVGVPRFS